MRLLADSAKLLQLVLVHPLLVAQLHLANMRKKVVLRHWLMAHIVLMTTFYALVATQKELHVLQDNILLMVPLAFLALLASSVLQVKLQFHVLLVTTLLEALFQHVHWVLKVRLQQEVQHQLSQLQISGQFQDKLLLFLVLEVILALQLELRLIARLVLFVHKVQLQLRQHLELFKTKQIYFIKSLAHLVQFVEVVQELLLLLDIIQPKALVQLQIYALVVIHALQARLVLTKPLVMKVFTTIIQEHLDLLAQLVLPVLTANKVLKQPASQVCTVMWLHRHNSTWRVLLVLFQLLVPQAQHVLLVLGVMHALKKVCLLVQPINVQQGISATLVLLALNHKQLLVFHRVTQFNVTQLFTRRPHS